MWSEELNKKIKQASEQHIPKYDESAWVKMEALLNKQPHLKKDGKRRLLYIFFACFLIVGSTLLLNKDWSRRIPGPDVKTIKQKSILVKERNDTGNSIALRDTKAVKNFDFSNEIDKKNKIVSRGSYKKNFTPEKQIQNRLTGFTESSSIVSADENNRRKLENKNIKVFPGDDSKMKELNKISLHDQNKELEAPPVLLQEQTMKDSLNNKINTGKEDEQTSTIPQHKKIKNKNIFSRLSFSASAGPDVSGVALNNPGKTKISYGAGIAYTISKRFSIKSGFYAANKIYSSSPDDYNPPASYWTYNVDLKRVDANCKVYEIPLAVQYSFKEKDQHHWFAALGLSSYLMKKETYHYLYKNQTGNLLYRAWTLKGKKNKHYFSVISISGGYAYKLNRTFSLMAEPYVKIPTKGVGYGKIKLKSSGIMFTLSASPFK